MPGQYRLLEVHDSAWLAPAALGERPITLVCGNPEPGDFYDLSQIEHWLRTYPCMPVLLAIEHPQEEADRPASTEKVAERASRRDLGCAGRTRSRWRPRAQSHVDSFGD